MKDKELISRGFKKEPLDNYLTKYTFQKDDLSIVYYKHLHNGCSGCTITENENCHKFDDYSYVDYTIRRITDLEN